MCCGDTSVTIATSHIPQGMPSLAVSSSFTLSESFSSQVKSLILRRQIGLGCVVDISVPFGEGTEVTASANGACTRSISLNCGIYGYTRLMVLGWLPMLTGVRDTSPCCDWE